MAGCPPRPGLQADLREKGLQEARSHQKLWHRAWRETVAWSHTTAGQKTGSGQGSQRSKARKHQEGEVRGRAVPKSTSLGSAGALEDLCPRLEPTSRAKAGQTRPRSQDPLAGYRSCKGAPPTEEGGQQGPSRGQARSSSLSISGFTQTVPPCSRAGSDTVRIHTGLSGEDWQYHGLGTGSATSSFPRGACPGGSWQCGEKGEGREGPGKQSDCRAPCDAHVGRAYLSTAGPSRGHFCLSRPRASPREQQEKQAAEHPSAELKGLGKGPRRAQPSLGRMGRSN